MSRCLFQFYKDLAQICTLSPQSYPQKMFLKQAAMPVFGLNKGFYPEVAIAIKTSESAFIGNKI